MNKIVPNQVNYATKKKLNFFTFGKTGLRTEPIAARKPRPSLKRLIYHQQTSNTIRSTSPGRPSSGDAQLSTLMPGSRH